MVDQALDVAQIFVVVGVLQRQRLAAVQAHALGLALLRAMAGEMFQRILQRKALADHRAADQVHAGAGTQIAQIALDIGKAAAALDVFAQLVVVLLVAVDREIDGELVASP